MKQQKIGGNKSGKKHVVVESDKKPVIPSILAGIDPEIANQPVRAINFVEVYDMEGPRVAFFIRELGKAHDPAKGGYHYFIPIRHGKITTDILFENEFLNVVKDLCEVMDGQIVLKDGAKDVHVIRQRI